MSSREAILARIRAAVGEAPGRGDGVDGEIPRTYQRTREQQEGTVERFRERVADYKATVERVPADSVVAAVAAALHRYGATRVAAPSGVALPEGVTHVPDSPPMSAVELDAVDAVVTGSTLGIAETGTIVLTGDDLCGRRALTLVPDVHVCVVRAADVVDDVPAAVARLTPGRPLTWISGPSATSDIELDRVEGVHGPRTLHVLVVDG